MTLVLSHQGLNSFIGLPAGQVKLARTSEKQMSGPTSRRPWLFPSKNGGRGLSWTRCQKDAAAGYVDDGDYANAKSTQNFITGVL